MQTYDYRLIEKPKEQDLKALGAAGWRMAGFGTDGRDGSLAWVIMECTQSEAHVLSTASNPTPEPIKHRPGRPEKRN